MRSSPESRHRHQTSSRGQLQQSEVAGTRRCAGGDVCDHGRGSDCFAIQDAKREKVQQQLVAAEKLIKTASTGGAGTPKPPKLKEDCNVERLKKLTDVADFRQWVRTLELSLEAQYDWKFADLVVQAIRDEKEPITVSSPTDNEPGRFRRRRSCSHAIGTWTKRPECSSDT